MSGIVIIFWSASLNALTLSWMFYTSNYSDFSQKRSYIL